MSTPPTQEQVEEILKNVIGKFNTEQRVRLAIDFEMSLGIEPPFKYAEGYYVAEISKRLTRSLWDNEAGILFNLEIARRNGRWPRFE